MPKRSVLCPCGMDVEIPEIPPPQLSCRNCGEPLQFKIEPNDGAVRARDLEREPIRPLPPRRPWYPILLLGSAGLVLSAALVLLVAVFSGTEARRHPAIEEPVRRKFREEEPPMSIPEIPYHAPLPPLPTLPPAPPSDPPSVKPERPSQPEDPAAALAQAQELSRRVTLLGVVGAILQHESRLDEQKAVQADARQSEEELRLIVASLGERPEARRVADRIRPGDALIALGTVDLGTLGPAGFIKGLRAWLRDLQPGVLTLATVRRDGVPLTVPVGFPDITEAQRILIARSAPVR